MSYGYGQSADSEDSRWVIWNGFYGVATFVTLGDIDDADDGRWAWLEEPFDMVGPFDLDELETLGCIRFEECLVMSWSYWRVAQRQLRMEGLELRRAAEERLQAEFNERAHFRFQHEHSSGHSHGQSHGYRSGQGVRDSAQREVEHRQVLNLPRRGPLKPADIKSAYRKLAQKMHPDVGGTTEQFQRITDARDQLLAMAS